MNYYLKVLQNYATFKGRARRSEYWYFALFNTVIAIVFFVSIRVLNKMGFSYDENYGFRVDEDILKLTTTISYISIFFNLSILIPTIAVGVRRMHDVGKSGWFLLIPIYSLILACTKGTQGDNEYGSDPKIGVSNDSDKIVIESVQKEKLVNNTLDEEKIIQLRKIKELLDGGIFTEEEFELEKIKILES